MDWGIISRNEANSNLSIYEKGHLNRKTTVSRFISPAISVFYFNCTLSLWVRSQGDWNRKSHLKEEKIENKTNKKKKFGCFCSKQSSFQDGWVFLAFKVWGNCPCIFLSISNECVNLLFLLWVFLFFCNVEMGSILFYFFLFLLLGDSILIITVILRFGVLCFEERFLENAVQHWIITPAIIDKVLSFLVV